MPSQALFPTLVYQAPLQASGWKSFNDRLLLECRQYREDDTAGQAWSARRYPGGYTSYGSLARMHTISPTFALLERKLRRHVNRFARSLELDLEDPRLDRFMAAPPRRSDCQPENRPWVTVPADAGTVVLFESWLRHEVPPNPVTAERVSVSFNFNWF
jgi:hypothetical protein